MSVELTTTATIPTNTSVDVTVYEDTDSDGTAENQETVTIGGGTNTYTLSTLNGTLSNDYWADFALSTSDTSTTPSVDSATIDPADPVAVSTLQPSSVQDTQATLEGELTDMGSNSSVDVYFEYRTTGSSTWNTTATQTLSSAGTFSETVTGLSTSTEYEYQAVATGTDSSDTGGVITFTTLTQTFEETTTITDAISVPEDEGTGLPSGEADYTSAGHVAGLVGSYGSSSYVDLGMGFTADHTNNLLDIGSGLARLHYSGTVNVQDSAGDYVNTWDGGMMFAVEVPAFTGLNLWDGGVNHIYITVDLTQNNQASYVVNNTGDKPAEPSLKIGEVDTSNDTHDDTINREPATEHRELSGPAIGSNPLTNIQGDNLNVDSSGALNAVVGGSGSGQRTADYFVLKNSSNEYEVVDDTGSVVFTETDQYAAHTAISYAVDNHPAGGGKTVIGTGVFWCDPNQIWVGDNDILTGMGRSTVLKYNDGVDLPDPSGIVRIDGTSSDYITDAEVSYIYFDGNKANITSSHLNGELLNVVYADGCRILGTWGVDSINEHIDTDDTLNCKVLFNTAKDCDGYGIHISTNSGANIVGFNYAENCGHANTRGGIDQWDTASGSVFIGNIARDNYQNYHISGSGAFALGNQSLGSTTEADDFSGVDHGARFVDKRSSDPTNLNDGMVWYRTDTDEYKGVENGTVVTFQTS